MIFYLYFLQRVFSSSFNSLQIYIEAIASSSAHEGVKYSLFSSLVEISNDYNQTISN